jgi:N-acyl amino acid synthase of PEP-CTERM/exosortase system
VRGLVHLSNEVDITHWCAIMERPLLRLLRSSAIHFQHLGPLIAHHGLRQPAFGRISSILARVNREQPDIWNFVTENGKLWTPKKAIPLAA